MKDRNAYVPVNYISPEACTLLAATETAAARRTEVLDAEDSEYDSNCHGSTLQSAWDGFLGPHCVSQSMPPPKRFYRIFWQSISVRLLHRSDNAATLL